MILKLFVNIKFIGTDIFSFQTFLLSLVEIQSQIFLAYLVWTFDLGMYCKEGNAMLNYIVQVFPNNTY